MKATINSQYNKQKGILIRWKLPSQITTYSKRMRFTKAVVFHLLLTHLHGQDIIRGNWNLQLKQFTFFQLVFNSILFLEGMSHIYTPKLFSDLSWVTGCKSAFFSLDGDMMTESDDAVLVRKVSFFKVRAKSVVRKRRMIRFIFLRSSWRWEWWRPPPSVLGEDTKAFSLNSSKMLISVWL